MSNSIKSNEIRNISEIRNIDSRLKEAAALAIRDLTSSEGENIILSTIEILNHKNTSITIDEITDSNDSTKKYLVVYSGTDQLLFKDEINKLRYIYLSNLYDCRVFVKCKLLRIMFHKCNKCQISLRASVVGMAEFFDCWLTNINIRILNGDIPLTRIESCKDIHIFQSNSYLVYLVYTSVDVTGTIVDQNSGARQTDYELGKLFWDEQGQIFICLSREEGFAMTPMKYILNDISHNIISK
jgi:hypothetical protein